MTENPKHPGAEPTHDEEQDEHARVQPSVPAELPEEPEDGGVLDIHNSDG